MDLPKEHSLINDWDHAVISDWSGSRLVNIERSQCISLCVAVGEGFYLEESDPVTFFTRSFAQWTLHVKVNLAIGFSDGMELDGRQRIAPFRNRSDSVPSHGIIASETSRYRFGSDVGFRV